MQLRLDALGAEAFVDDIGVVADGTARRDGRLEVADVTTEGVLVGVQSEWYIATRTTRLPTAVLAEGSGGGATAIVKY